MLWLNFSTVICSKSTRTGLCCNKVIIKQINILLIQPLPVTATKVGIRIRNYLYITLIKITGYIFLQLPWFSFISILFCHLRVYWLSQLNYLLLLHIFTTIQHIPILVYPIIHTTILIYFIHLHVPAHLGIPISIFAFTTPFMLLGYIIYGYPVILLLRFILLFVYLYIGYLQ